jgi:ribosome-binding ATPase YchF (GTP1/OBG family)
MLEAGIVGLPAAGKTTLFNALTRAGVGPDFGNEHVGMAPIADERLDRIAEVISPP